MKLAVSNIALPEYDHRVELGQLAALGIDGVEVSPSRVWEDWWRGLTPAMVDRYRRDVEGAGLRVVGLHTLFWRQDGLGLFKGAEATASTVDYLVHLSRLCADLGGRTLVFGSGRARMRGNRSLADAIDEAAAMFAALAERTREHGTCFAFEALGVADTDFINSIVEALMVVEAVDDPVLRTHLDAKALVQADEIDSATFRAARPTMVHFHANEPDLGVLGSSGEVDHTRLGQLLREIGYSDYVSVEQRMLDPHNPMADVARSIEELRRCYGGDAS